MTLTARLLAVLLIIAVFVKQARSEAYYYPGYMLLALPLDAHSYAAGAGPAGGFGVAAAADNPAALAFGYRFQLDLDLPIPERDKRMIGMHSIGYLHPSGLAMGASLVRVDPDFERPDNYQYISQLTLAYRFDSSLAVGASVSYSRARHTEEWVFTGWGMSQARKDAVAEAITADIGIRLHGPWVLDPPVRDAAKTAAFIGNRIRPRWSLGVALNDLELSAPLDTSYWRNVEPPTRVQAGAVYRPLHTPFFGVSLAGSWIQWLRGFTEGGTPVGRRRLSFSHWRAGFGIELGGIVEAGAAVGGFMNGEERSSVYASIGPPFFRITAQAYGQNTYVYEGPGGYDGLWAPYLKEEPGRVSISISWPFRYYRN